jgi:hypothetical protein
MVIVGSGRRKIHQKVRRTRLHQSSARTGEEVIGSGHSLERGDWGAETRWFVALSTCTKSKTGKQERKRDWISAPIFQAL